MCHTEIPQRVNRDAAGGRRQDLTRCAIKGPVLCGTPFAPGNETVAPVARVNRPPPKTPREENAILNRLTTLIVVAAISAPISSAAQVPAIQPAAEASDARQLPPAMTAETLLSARPGSTIKAPAGRLGPMDLKGLPKGLTIDLSAATVRGLRIYGAKNLTLIGGRVEGMPGRRGIEVYDSENLRVSGLRGVGAGLYLYRVQKALVEGLEMHRARGFFAEDSSNVTVRQSKFIGASGDSLNFNGVRKLIIEDSAFIGSGYLTDDPLSAKNQHPDAIQGWGDNSDVTIRRVKIACRCQGIFLKDGVNDGVVIEDVLAILDDYKWVVTVQNATTPPKLTNVKGWGMPGAPKPALDFRNAQSSQIWTNGGGNEFNGEPVKSSEIKLK
jgi:hypothetical protein